MAIILKGYNRFSGTARWLSYAHDPERSNHELVQPRRFQLFYQADNHGFANSKGGRGTMPPTKEFARIFRQSNERTEIARGGLPPDARKIQ
jgi:hypothetical protein